MKTFTTINDDIFFFTFKDLFVTRPSLSLSGKKHASELRIISSHHLDFPFHLLLLLYQILLKTER